MEPNTYIVIFASLYGIISVLVGIIVHELGHLLAARLLGIEVSGISVGFGPEILGFTDSYGVRWKLAPLLVGGACNFPDRLNSEAEVRRETGSTLRILCE